MPQPYPPDAAPAESLRSAHTLDDSVRYLHVEEQRSAGLEIFVEAAPRRLWRSGFAELRSVGIAL
jgi:hypothetical protein